MYKMIKDRAPAAQKSFADCSGCSLCLVVCPVWRNCRDIAMTPHGRAKALQHGADVTQIAASIESCTLCGACEPMCPEKIDLIGMTLDLRRALMMQSDHHSTQTFSETTATVNIAAARALLPDAALRSNGAGLARIKTLLESTGTIEVSTDDGTDISRALETGTDIPAQRLAQFLAPLRRLKEIVVVDGLLLHQLLRWLPGVKVIGLGEALSRLDAVRRMLRATDLYVIEPRAYHADYQRLVGHYERLRSEYGCTLSLDLQRIAIPVRSSRLHEMDDFAQARWLLHGRKASRIVVESLEDRALLEGISDCPVVHLAELLEAVDNKEQGRSH